MKMGAADDVASVQITADVSDYVEGMKQAAGATTQAMDGIKASTQAAAGVARDSLGRFVRGAQEAADAAKDTGVAADELAGKLPPVADGAERAGSAMGGFGDSIRQAGSKIRSEGRFANFIARDIQSIIPTAGAAGQAVAGLVSGIAYGSGIAVAVSAVRLLVAAFKDTGGGIKQLSTDSAAALAKMKADVAEIIAAMNDPTQSGAKKRAEVDPREAKRDTSFQALEDAKAQLKVEEDIFDVEAAKGDASGGGVLAAQKKVELARQQLALDEGALRTAKDIVETLKQQEATHGDSETAAKINAQRLQQEQQLQGQLEAIKAQGLQGNEKLEADYVAKVEGYEQALVERVKQIRAESTGKGDLSAGAADAAEAAARVETEAKVTAELEAYRSELKIFATEQAKEQAAVEGKFTEQRLKAEEEAAKKIRELREHQDEERLKQGELEQKYNEKNAKSYVKDFIGPVASASANFFKSIVLQQENVGTAILSLMTNLAGAAIDGLVKMAEQSITTALTTTAASKAAAASETAGNIAVAATAAAAAVAGIPIIGPELAVAQFIETAAVLSGMSAPYLATAKGGMGSVPYDDMPFLLHKREMVMPEPLASGARNLFSAFSNGTPAPSGGNGGGDSGPPIHVHLHEHYGPGVIVDQHSMDKHYSSPEFQTSIDRAIRTGKARFK